jgi:hypothetical protein
MSSSKSQSLIFAFVRLRLGIRRLGILGLRTLSLGLLGLVLLRLVLLGLALLRLGIFILGLLRLGNLSVGTERIQANIVAVAAFIVWVSEVYVAKLCESNILEVKVLVRVS